MENKMTFQLSVQIGDDTKDFMLAASDTEEAIHKIKSWMAENDTHGRVLVCKSKPKITLI